MRNYECDDWNHGFSGINCSNRHQQCQLPPSGVCHPPSPFTRRGDYHIPSQRRGLRSINSVGCYAHLHDRDHADNVLQGKRLRRVKIVGLAQQSQSQPLADSPQQRQLVSAVGVLIMSVSVEDRRRQQKQQQQEGSSIVHQEACTSTSVVITPTTPPPIARGVGPGLVLTSGA